MRNLICFFLLFTLIGCQKEFSPPPSPGRMIKSFKLAEGQIGEANIYKENDSYKVLVWVASNANLKQIVPQITISDDAKISPASETAIDASVNPKVTYQVTAADGQSRKWEIEFRTFSTAISDYDTYSIASQDNQFVMQVKGNSLFNEKYFNNALIDASTAISAEGENLKNWQEWHIIYHSTVDGVKYYLIRNLHSGHYLQGVDQGSQVKQYQGLTSNRDIQLWKLVQSVDAGKFSIVNKANDLALALAGNSLTGLSVQMAAKSGLSPSQQWLIKKLPRDSYRDGEVTNFFNRTTGSVAFDQGTSIPLADGRVLWITQDAWYQGSLASNGNLLGNHFISYSNSAIIQPSKTDWSPNAPMMTADGRVHQIGNLVPKRAGKDWSWPGPGIQLGESVYLHASEGNGLGAATDNQAIYKLTPETPTHWKVERTAPAGLTLSEKLVQYTSGMVKAADGYVYAFGTRMDPNSFGFNSFLHVARFPVDNPMNWTFWNGNAWTATAATTNTAAVNTAMATNSVGYLNGKYIHLTMDQGYYCGIPSINMYISTATNPTGPFTNKKLVYTLTEFYKGYNARVYTPSLHVAADNGRDELLITYSINYGACQENDADKHKESDGNFDPYYYRNKGVRVPYEKVFN